MVQIILQLLYLHLCPNNHENTLTSIPNNLTCNILCFHPLIQFHILKTHNLLNPKIQFLQFLHMLPWQINSIFIILIISLHKPSNLDKTGCPALFSFFMFCLKPTLFFINLRKFTGKWCSKWCSNFVRFQPDFLCFSCLPAALKSMTFTICSAARS